MTNPFGMNAKRLVQQFRLDPLDGALRIGVAYAAFVVIVTELLSAIALLDRIPLLSGYLFGLALLLTNGHRLLNPSVGRMPLPLFAKIIASFCSLILVVLLVIALVSPPRMM